MPLTATELPPTALSDSALAGNSAPREPPDAASDLAARADARGVIPGRAEVMAVIGSCDTRKSVVRSFAHLTMSVALTLATALAAWAFIPLTWAALPLWIGYALVAGTFAVGIWVVAHECGHRAFGGGNRMQDVVGFTMHSLLLVPYFSWQRSHAIHHARTNHVTEGETHVPKVAGTPAGERAIAAHRRLGARLHGALTIAGRWFFGWPIYLVTGSTGGPERGTTNHFWPGRPFSTALFPDRWKRKVAASAVAVAAVFGGLVAWAVAAGSVAPVLALYVGPYLVCNAWVVTYTWLHHTDVDVAHFDGDDWTFVRGAFCSIDRPYGRTVDLLHHRIGSTHAVHHLASHVPHYRAAAVTDALAEAYPDLYRYDPTPIPKALWRVAKDCHVLEPVGDEYRFTHLDS